MKCIDVFKQYTWRFPQAHSIFGLYVLQPKIILAMLVATFKHNNVNYVKHCCTAILFKSILCLTSFFQICGIQHLRQTDNNEASTSLSLLAGIHVIIIIVVIFQAIFIILFINFAFHSNEFMMPFKLG